MTKHILLLSFFLSLVSYAPAQRYDAPGNANPIVPGYFADPTVKQFGDTYYMYATTDGSGAGFGPAQCWTSKDFVHWSIRPMNWPTSHWIWAPDVLHNPADGKYYYFYCQPCKVHVGVSDTPSGPWHNLLGESEAVLIPDRFVKNAITLDGQSFVDDDGKMYMYWGTWGIYEGFGCGSGRLNPDMKSFAETHLIPNTEVEKFFEAPFVLKRNGTYYFMYSRESCHDSTYHVAYATSDKPLGPYKYRGVILKTSADGTVHGPGHHCVLQKGNDYYIVYHRHDNPHSNRGFHRQVCADKLVFNADGSIAPVEPTHTGIGALGKSVVADTDLAFGAKCTASSYYDHNFKPELATDHNNGTLWRARGNGQEWFTVDLGKVQPIGTVETRWEYGTQFYQYLVETSTDGHLWNTFSDRRTNRLSGSPMVDWGTAQARYVRITFTGGQKVGFPAALWEVNIYAKSLQWAPQQWVGLHPLDYDGREWRNDCGMLGGSAVITNGTATPVRIDGRDALKLTPGSIVTLRHAQLGQGKNHTILCSEWKCGKWTATTSTLTESHGALTLKVGKDEAIVGDIRMWNYPLEAQEISEALTTAQPREPIADHEKRGLLVDITPEGYAAGDTVWGIGNGGTLGGDIEPTNRDPGALLTVCDTLGRKAFRFTGRQCYRSTFPMPATLRDNAPYRLEAWILNPNMEANECIADFTSTHDEMEKLMVVCGTEPRCGLLNHYGWYEDAGWHGLGKWGPEADRETRNALEGKWLHYEVGFDGRFETVKINGKVVSHKDIQLLLKPSTGLTLGLNQEGEWPFTGYLAELKLWDE